MFNQDDRYLHVNNQDIPEKYRNCMLHIALERADTNKDWVSFRKLYNMSPKTLKNHLDMTSLVFDYNYLNLDEQERNELLR